MNPIILALDTPDLDDAERLAATMDGAVGAFKIGHVLFGRHGPAAVTRIGEHGPVFLDLKLHDIPTVVGRAAQTYAELGVAMLTVHAGGGRTMVAAAVEGLAAGARSGEPEPIILAVTVLTSMSDEELGQVNAPPAAEQAPALADLAVGEGAQGLVCAPRDLEAVRFVVGRNPVIVTPGVRPAGSEHDDHARAATPAEALAAGADRIVIGRPITDADDPVAAARAILDDLGA